MRPGGHDLEAQQDFVTLLRFLFDDGPEVQLAKTRFGELALALRLVRADTEQARASSVRRVRAAKLAVEDLLVRVMSRWERPVDEATGGVASTMVALQPGDVAATSRFSAASTSLPPGSCSIARLWILEVGAVPVQLHARLSRKAGTCRSDGRYGRSCAAIGGGDRHGAHRLAGRGALPSCPHAQCTGEILGGACAGQGPVARTGVPPTMPPYELQGPFAGVRDGAATKTLVFSGWKVVPPSLAGLIGYEAERRAASGGRNDPEARKQRSSRQLLSPALKLNARTGEEQLQRVAVLGLVYPSAVLPLPSIRIASDDPAEGCPAFARYLRRSPRR